MMLPPEFFHRNAMLVAIELLGKFLVRDGLKLRIIETECYFLTDKGSHASLGYTEKRKALFMDGGTIYMYYARGKPSLNFSAEGEGNAVLIKSASADCADEKALQRMLKLNPMPDGRFRKPERLASGQTLVCRSLGMDVPDYDAKQMADTDLRVIDEGYRPEKIIQTVRLGIPDGRDAHLPFRFIDHAFRDRCTAKPPKGAYEVCGYNETVSKNQKFL
ncbi:DNA-3-methyladenine glycosylase [Seleniivibrio woodruffii]|uniref:Putative 3-methyladenine DNA glycosylase n=2 Tax=Seleniivibrio woodruffii TaxID=1078050 RepID=A0A4V2PRM6_9BACT|nr:DNA-3-methyladenine glycosylase [Seleniivibrio woodruffii]TCK59471.1 DNA-3-methyladenine glycosylase [Seleniivibrio woodruffii]TVZ35488.1 DNA-3-methyladenine glycosylase [Seleniivibrio woodruffii]